MIDIVTIPTFRDVDDVVLIKHVPNLGFLEFKENMYFYYGNKYDRYNWIDQFPIKIDPKKKDKLGYPLINIIPLYIPIIQKNNINLVVYVEPYLINNNDNEITNSLFPPPIIIIDTKNVRLKKTLYN